MSEGRRRQMAEFKQRVNLHVHCLFVLFRPSVDWMMLTCIDECNLL